jgi:hypothetical protein
MTNINNIQDIEHIRFQLQIEKVDTPELFEEMNTFFCILDGMIK